MNINKTAKNWVAIIMTCLGLSLSQSAHAVFINGDFSDGLNGWSGEVLDFTNDPGGETIEVADFGLFSDIFVTSPGSVTLNTTFDIGGAFLFQAITFANNVAELTLDFFHSDVINTADAFSVLLTEETTGFSHNFVADGNTVDISALAGLDSVFEISLIDLDFIDESFTVSDISIATTSVAAPSAISLILFGFVAFANRKQLLGNKAN